MARNLALLLDTEHHRLRELIQRSLRGRGDLGAVRGRLRADLDAHLAGDEAVGSQDRCPPEPSAVERCRQAAEQLRALVDEHVPQGSGQVDDGPLPALQGALEQLAEAEQSVVRSCVPDGDAMRLRDLGAVFTRARDRAVKQGRSLPRVPRSLDLPVAALQQEARRAGISGRSLMTREELIEAISRAREA